MSKRVFYVVYFRDQRLQAAFDAMRLIANPHEKSRAHITVRGPYRQRYDVRGLDRKIRDTEIVTDGAGSFFDGDQNTVFIGCRSRKLREVWLKRDFGFHPHITIYDGSSRDFANLLYGRLLDLAIRIRFRVGGLSPLPSVKGQYSMDLRQAFDASVVADITGARLDVAERGRAFRGAEDRIDRVACRAGCRSALGRSPPASGGSRDGQWSVGRTRHLVTSGNRRGGRRVVAWISTRFSER